MFTAVVAAGKGLSADRRWETKASAFGVATRQGGTRDDVSAVAAVQAPLLICF